MNYSTTKYVSYFAFFFPRPLYTELWHDRATYDANET